MIVEQLLGIVRADPRRGHDGDPRRAVGERRAHGRRDGLLHGEGRDPLPRPDRRAARTARRAALGVPRRRAPRGTATGSTRPGRDERPTARAATSRRARPAGDADAPAALELVGVRRASAASAPSTTCRSPSRPGEILGIIGAERRRQDHAVRPHLRLHARSTPGASCSAAATSPDMTACRAGSARPRAFVPGRPPVPGAHRRGAHRRRARPVGRGARPVPARVPPPGRRSTRSSKVDAPRRRARSSCWGSRRSAPSSCTSCRPDRGASSTSPASSRTARR